VNANFQDEFRLETLQKYCCENWFSFDLYLTPGDNRMRVGRRPNSRCSESAEVSVLWLTPRLFISKYLIFAGTGTRRLDDFSVEWQARNPYRKYWFSVYSLSSFEDSGSDDPSVLPLELLRHAFTLLPLDDVLRVELFAGSPQRCPVHMAMAFLSSIPQDAHWNRPVKEYWTDFIVDFFFSVDDLRTILSHPFHPEIKLIFRVAELAPMNDSIKMGDFIELLRDSPYLRAVTLPRKLVEANSSSELPLFEQIVFTSPSLSIFYTHGKMSPLWFHTITRTHSITAVHIESASCYWGEQWQDALRSFIQPLFMKDATLERLTIQLKAWATPHQPNFHAALGEIFLRMANVMTACTSRRLDFVNVEVDLVNYQRDGSDNWRKNMWIVGRIRAWDEVLFPSLALNFCRNHFQVLAKGAVMPLAIKAVNEGIIYKRTTHHVPFDMSAANASVIFLFVKTEACGVLHDSTVKTTLRGTALEEEVPERDVLEEALGAGAKRQRI
jgi:hypothetical protein